MTDIYGISKYMTRTDLLEKLKKEKLPEDHLNNILSAISSNIEVTFLTKGQVIFKVDDPGDKFYIILKGRLAILDTREQKVNTTIDDYYDQLLMLRKGDEKYLFNKTIKANPQVFPITDMNELDKLNELFFKIMLKKRIDEQEKSIDNLKAFMKEHGRNLNMYGISEDYLYEITLSDDSYTKALSWENYLYSKIRFTADEQMELERFKGFSKNEIREFRIFQYKKFMNLYSGQYFGDYALDSSNKKRQNTVIAEDDSIIVYIDQKIYSEYISEEKAKIRLKYVNFIHDNFFFKSIKFTHFDKIYFKSFVPHEYERGYNIFKQGDKADMLVIVHEGEIELSTNLSILDIHSLIKEFIGTLKKNKYFSEDLGLLESFDNNMYLKNKSKEFNDKCQLKKLIPLYKLSSKDIIGTEEIIMNCNRITKATVISKKAIIYTLELDKLNKILEAERFTNYPFYKIGIMKIISLMKRLFHYKDTSFKVLQKLYNTRTHKEDAITNFSDCVVKAIIKPTTRYAEEEELERMPILPKLKVSSDNMLDKILKKQKTKKNASTMDIAVISQTDELMDEENVDFKQKDKVNINSKDDNLIKSIKKEINGYRKKFVCFADTSTVNEQDEFYVSREKLLPIKHAQSSLKHLDFLQVDTNNNSFNNGKENIEQKRSHKLLPIIEKFRIGKQRRESFDKKLAKSYTSRKQLSKIKKIKINNRTLKLTTAHIVDNDLNNSQEMLQSDFILVNGNSNNNK
jgi:CRP-like cAMP-binding protein